ncbi:hydroxyisourate hydrolase [Deinococcus aluminii]|uniref:5-hydroxyisourate hydrolase n=1 Tax=Deinococcus aluminii TaxID=1656885 RepID=A0ABP9XI21_9DEIO
MAGQTGQAHSGLTTHVLDTARGRPAAGVQVELYAVDGGERRKVTEAVTNSDGRTDAPLIERGSLQPGTYELTFHVAPYYEGFEAAPQVPFLDLVTLRFTVSDTSGHYHVPLVMTPWSYSTYRGS